jgi:RNA polymerase sigma factor (sigma-70 family)
LPFLCFDLQSFEELYEQYKKMVYNLSLNYVQNHEDAQEITQDVFVSVHQRLSDFEHNAEISTWLYRIAINKCLDHIKRAKRKKRFGFVRSLFGGDDGISHDLFHFDHPGVQLEQKEALKNIFAHINELPANQKTALLLSKTEQRSQADVALIMGISEKAAESLIQRAKKNLADRLDQSEGKQ